MRILQSPLLCSVLLSLCLAPQALASSVTLELDQFKKGTRVQVDDIVTLRLPQSDQSGSQWSIRNYDRRMLEIFDESTEKSRWPKPGIESVRVIRLKAVRRGDTTISLSARGLPRRSPIPSSASIRIRVDEGDTKPEPLPERPRDIVLTDRDKGRKIDVRVGDNLEVRLRFSSGTAYAWEADRIPRQLKPMGQPREEADGDRRPGSPYFKVFRYRVDRDGNGYLRFALRLQNDRDKRPEKEWDVDIRASKR